MAEERVRQVMREATEAEWIAEYWIVTHAENYFLLLMEIQKKFVI
jgi:hypothetical protein